MSSVVLICSDPTQSQALSVKIQTSHITNHPVMTTVSGSAATHHFVHHQEVTVLLFHLKMNTGLGLGSVQKRRLFVFFSKCFHQLCWSWPVCWTKWFDRDDPSGTGDWETLSNLLEEHPGVICAQPLYIESVIVGSNAPAWGQNFL